MHGKTDKRHFKGLRYMFLKRCEDWTHGKYGKTCEPGEIVGLDMLEIKTNERIRVLIDYFTRKAHAKMLTTKDNRKVLDFIKAVHKKVRFKKAIMDNG